MYARENNPLVVVSPHLDDGVFSCGDLLARSASSTVITVCTGLPENPARLTSWDQQCGFLTARSALRTRLDENREALRLLGSKGVELGLPDSQYVRDWHPFIPLLRESLKNAIARLHPRQVVMPLGLFHDDHIRVSDVLLSLLYLFPAAVWLAYEDVPYRARPAAVAQRLSVIRQRGIRASRVSTPCRSDRKSRAVWAYGSQLRGFGAYPDDLAQPEGYWRLTRSGEAS